jgi:hypothetical protein
MFAPTNDDSHRLAARRHVALRGGYLAIQHPTGGPQRMLTKMGQFLVETLGLPGSVLSGNQQLRKRPA